MDQFYYYLKRASGQQVAGRRFAHLNNKSAADCDESNLIQVEDFSSSLVKSLELSLDAAGNHEEYLRKRRSLDNIRSSLSNLYHEEIKANFKFIDTEANKVFSSKSNEFHSLKKIEYKYDLSRNATEFPDHHHHHQHHRKFDDYFRSPNSKLNMKSSRRAKPEFVNDFEFKGGRAKIMIDLDAQKENSRQINTLKYVSSSLGKHDNQRLKPTFIDKLNMSDENASKAKYYYFHPRSLSFTPNMIIKTRPLSSKARHLKNFSLSKSF